MSVTAGETLCCIHDDILENTVKSENLVAFCAEKMATVTGEFKNTIFVKIQDKSTDLAIDRIFIR